MNQRSGPCISESHPGSTYEDLDIAICHLALITAGPPDSEGILVPDEVAHRDNEDEERTGRADCVQSSDGEEGIWRLEILKMNQKF